MKYWNDLNMEERRAVIFKHGVEKVDDVAKACFFAAAELVKDDKAAVRMVWCIAVNDFLINTPEEVAEHCRKLAAIERRNSQLTAALQLCREKLDEMYGPGLAMDIRNASVDDEGFWFSYTVWNRNGLQTMCIRHTELPSPAKEDA